MEEIEVWLTIAVAISIVTVRSTICSSGCTCSGAAAGTRTCSSPLVVYGTISERVLLEDSSAKLWIHKQLQLRILGLTNRGADIVSLPWNCSCSSSSSTVTCVQKNHYHRHRNYESQRDLLAAGYSYRCHGTWWLMNDMINFLFPDDLYYSLSIDLYIFIIVELESSSS